MILKNLRQKVIDSELTNKQLNQEVKRNALLITELEKEVKIGGANNFDDRMATNQFEQNNINTNKNYNNLIEEEKDQNNDRFHNLSNLVETLKQ